MSLVTGSTREDGLWAPKFGRKRPVARGPRFKMRNYMLRSLPPAPASADYRTKAALVLANPYLNLDLGDCVIAAMGHIIGVITGNAGTPVMFTDSQITAEYSAIGGYVPGDPSTDGGCDEVTALNYWQNKGFAGGHRIAAWMSVDGSSPAEYRLALFLFEHLLLGMELPAAWVDRMPQASGFIWDVAGPPVMENGHAPMSAAYNSEGLHMDTWGLDGLLTDRAVGAYAIPAANGGLYCALSPEIIIKASQKAPTGFAWQQLLADFQAMT